MMNRLFDQVPENYDQGELMPETAPAIKEWLYAIFGAALIAAGIVVVLAIIQHWPLIASAHELVLEAIVTGQPACRVEVIEGTKVEHCVRTVMRF